MVNSYDKAGKARNLYFLSCSEVLYARYVLMLSPLYEIFHFKNLFKEACFTALQISLVSSY